MLCSPLACACNVAGGLQNALGGRPLPKGPALIPPLPYVPLDAAFLGDYVEQIKSGNAFPLLAAHYLLSRSRVWSFPGPRRSPALPLPLPVATLNALMGNRGPDDPFAPLRLRWDLGLFDGCWGLLRCPVLYGSCATPAIFECYF